MKSDVLCFPETQVCSRIDIYVIREQIQQFSASYEHVEFCLSKNIHIIDHEQKSISSKSCKKATFTQGLEDSTSF